MTFEHSIYARCNQNGLVTRVFSDFFEEPKENDILVKTGSGDEYVHAGYYTLFDNNFCHRYKVIDGKMIETTDEDKQKEIDDRPGQEPSEIEKRNAELTDTINRMADDQIDLDYRLSKIELGDLPYNE